MDNDPISHSQNSRKRTRVDEPSSSFHLAPSPDTISALSNASRLRDPSTHGLLNSSAMSAAEAAAVAAAAVGTSTPTSTTPILQPLHPPIPNFSAISQAPQLRPQNSISHTLPSEPNHPATGIYSIALPLPNPGRAHRFCQACDHVNHVRRKLCTNCGAPKPSAVRNAVGVRNVSDPENAQDRRPRPDEMSGMATGPIGQTSASGSLAHGLPIGGHTSDMYGHSVRGTGGHAPSVLASMAAQPSSTSSGFKSGLKLGGSGGDHQTHSLSMTRPGDDIPLPSSINQHVRYNNSNGLGPHSRRFGHTVLADPLVNPPQMPAHNVPSSSFLFAQKMFPFSPDRIASNEQYQLPSVHNNFGGSTGLQLHPSMSMEGNTQARSFFRGTEAQDMGHGYVNSGYQDIPGNGNAIGSHQQALISNLHGEGQGLDDGNMGRYTGSGGMRYNEQFNRHQTFGGQAAMDGNDGQQMFASAGGAVGRQSFFSNAPSSGLRLTGLSGGDHSTGISSGLHLQHGRSHDMGTGHDNMLVTGGIGGTGNVGLPMPSSGIAVESCGRDDPGRNVGGNEREMIDNGRRFESGRQNEGDKSSMTGLTGGSLEGSTNVEERGRQSDEGRFAIGRIVMREKNGVGEE